VIDRNERRDERDVEQRQRQYEDGPRDAEDRTDEQRHGGYLDAEADGVRHEQDGEADQGVDEQRSECGSRCSGRHGAHSPAHGLRYLRTIRIESTNARLTVVDHRRRFVRVEESFIPVYGVGETTERDLWRSGVTHWDAFEPSVVGSTTADRIQAYIDDARESLATGDTAFFAEQFPSQARWRLYETFADRAAFLDIETTGLDQRRHDVTTVSVRLGGETTTLVRGQDLTADRLQSVLGDADMLVTFNGARFDVPFLESAFEIDGVLDRPHLDVMYPCRRLDLTGGLKQIERDLGVERDRPDLSGEDAVRLWHDFQRGDESALETLVSYNREDVDHLETVTERVVDRLHAWTVPEDCDL